MFQPLQLFQTFYVVIIADSLLKFQIIAYDVKKLCASDFFNKLLGVLFPAVHVCKLHHQKFLTSSDTNQTVTKQKMARGLKLRI